MLNRRGGLRKARVALARWLAVIMHAMLRDGALFEAQGALKRDRQRRSMQADPVAAIPRGNAGTDDLRRLRMGAANRQPGLSQSNLRPCETR